MENKLRNLKWKNVYWMRTLSLLLVGSSLTFYKAAFQASSGLSSSRQPAYLPSHASEVDDKSVPGERLLYIVPLIQEDLANIISRIESWPEVGEACSSVSRGKVDLFFYYNKDMQQGDRALELALEPSPGWASVKSCFGRTGVIHAGLPAEQDGYPEGPSNMFFKLFAPSGLLNEFLQPYHHFFWSEWDVFPIKALWLDSLWRESLVGDFWMRGSSYMGPLFDAAIVMRAANWDWVGHLNGNALYKLHDSEFSAFLDIVQDYQPPNDYWKPFDVSMWKVLHNFPYMWKFYQRYRHYFQQASFIDHLGFTVCDKQVQADRENPSVFLIHGSRDSSGVRKYKAKFAQGVPVEVVPSAQWRGTMPADANISVFMRTYIKDLPFARLAVESVKKHFPAAKETVVVVPKAHFEAFRREMPEWVKVIGEPPLMVDSIQHKLTSLTMDLYVTGSFILRIDCDSVFMRPLLKKDMLLLGKPILSYINYNRLPKNKRVWRQGTSFAVGRNVTLEFSRTPQFMLIPRNFLREAREHIEALHNNTIRQFIESRREYTSEDRLAEDEGFLFSDINYMGAYAYYYQQDNFWMRDMSEEESGLYPLVPDFLCQANVRMARVLNTTAVTLEYMGKVLQGKATCDQLLGATMSKQT